VISNTTSFCIRYVDDIPPLMKLLNVSARSSMSKEETMSNNTASKRTAIAERLRLARELSGLSQGQVAEMLDLKRPAISEAEAGRRRVSAEELAKLSEIYAVSISWLAGVDSEREDVAQDKIDLAAREIAKLNDEDAEKLWKLLKVFRASTDES
jgi:transcriptional regulator with XRE-family HTH domain